MWLCRPVGRSRKTSVRSRQFTFCLIFADSFGAEEVAAQPKTSQQDAAYNEEDVRPGPTFLLQTQQRWHDDAYAKDEHAPIQ